MSDTDQVSRSDTPPWEGWERHGEMGGADHCCCSPLSCYAAGGDFKAHDECLRNAVDSLIILIASVDISMARCGCFGWMSVSTFNDSNFAQDELCSTYKYI